MKTLTIFSKHFWPESFKINDICFKLRKKFIIDVYTSYPAYNNLKYKKNLTSNKKYRGIHIKYFNSYSRKGNNTFSIFFDYLAYIFNLFLKTQFNLNKKSDVCLTFATSPIFQALPALYFSKIKKIPNIIWVQDLWPEVLEDTGYIKNKFVLRLVNIIVRFIYKNSDLIIAQSKSFEEHLKKKYKLKDKIVTLHQPSEFSFQKKKNIKNDFFYVTYAGNFGTAQDFDTIINAFSSNKINKKIRLNLVGSGKKFDYLKNKIKQKNLDKKIYLIGFKNKSKLTKILQNSSCFFISLKNGKSLNKTIPGKFQTYLAFGKPLIICSHSELNKLVLENKLGLVSKPNEIKKLINNLNKIYLLSEKQKNKIYITSKQIYKNFFEINKVTSQMEKYINFVLKRYAKKNIL